MTTGGKALLFLGSKDWLREIFLDQYTVSLQIDTILMNIVLCSNISVAGQLTWSQQRSMKHEKQDIIISTWSARLKEKVVVVMSRLRLASTTSLTSPSN